MSSRKKQRNKLSQHPKSAKTPIAKQFGIAGTLLASTVIGGIPAVVHGQETTAARDTARVEPTRLPPILVEGTRGILSSAKHTQPLRDIPQTITVIPQQIIQAQGATSLREVLRNVPGLTMNAGEGGATPGDNFNVRGFSARTDMFTDGVRDLGGYSRDSFNMEQVEVSKGPASAFTGRGSTGGAINTVSKTPNAQATRAVTGGWGSGDFKRATVDVNQPLPVPGGGTALRLNAMVHDAGVPGLDVIEKQAFGIAPSLAFGLGGATAATFAFSYSEQDNIPSYGIRSQVTAPPDSINPFRYYGLRSVSQERINESRAVVKVEHQLGATTEVQNQTTWNRSRPDRIVSYGNVDATRASVSHNSADEILSNQTNLIARLVTGPLRHAFVTGVEFVREKSRFARYVLSPALPPIADLRNPDPDDAWDGTATLQPDTRRATSTSIGAYAFETLSAGDKLELSGGLRWESFKPEYAQIGTTPVTPAAETSALSWRAGAVLKPRENGSVYAAYGTSFNPSSQGLSYEAASLLQPEENRSVEVGSKWDLFANRLSVSAAVFRTEKTNARTVDPEDPARQTILAGNQRAQGVDFGVGGRIADKFSLFGGYTYLESEIVKSGTPAEVGRELLNTPKHSWNLWTSYSLPGKADIALGAKFVDRRLATATLWAPSYRVYDAMLGYQLTKSIGLRLNMYNLADATYYESGRYWVPAARRSATLSTNINF